jgi:hypothetical protein
MMTFYMVQLHQWRLEDIEQMLPYELDIYSGILVNHLRDEAERLKKKG